MRPPLSFFAAGDPKAQPRVKATSFGGFARVYNPRTADDWKMIVRNEARRAWDASSSCEPWEGPLCVDLTFHMVRPKGHYNSKGQLKLSAPIWHTVKPDRDNLDKAILDTLTNLGIWHDDKQVCDGRIKKIYAQAIPGCWVTIREATT